MACCDNASNLQLRENYFLPCFPNTGGINPVIFEEVSDVLTAFLLVTLMTGKGKIRDSICATFLLGLNVFHL